LQLVWKRKVLTHLGKTSGHPEAVGAGGEFELEAGTGATVLLARVLLGVCMHLVQMVEVDVTVIVEME
jgi:hypothetical protein